MKLTVREGRARIAEKRGQGEQGSDSGPVINEESNFQAGDLTSSRPTVAATQCEMEHEKVVEGESDRDGGYCKWMLRRVAEPPRRDDWTR